MRLHHCIIQQETKMEISRLTQRTVCVAVLKDKALSSSLPLFYLLDSRCRHYIHYKSSIENLSFLFKYLNLLVKASVKASVTTGRTSFVIMRVLRVCHSWLLCLIVPFKITLKWFQVQHKTNGRSTFSLRCHVQFFKTRVAIRKVRCP